MTAACNRDRRNHYWLESAKKHIGPSHHGTDVAQSLLQSIFWFAGPPVQKRAEFQLATFERSLRR